MLPQAVLAIHADADDYYEAALAGLLSLRQWACTMHTDELAFCICICLCIVRKFVYKDIDIGMMLCASDMFCTYI